MDSATSHEQLRSRAEPRTRLKLYYDILKQASALNLARDVSRGVRVPKSRLQFSVYLSWSRLARHVRELASAHLIDEESLVPTDLGMQFVSDFEHFSERLVRRYNLPNEKG